MADLDAPRHQLASQNVAAHLRGAISSGALVPGERIRQEAVAAQLGTSRIPVREALRQLEVEGLVVLVPHAGARVAQMDLRELEELYRIREALEPLAASASVPLLADEQIEHLRGLVELVERSAEDLPTWLDADRRLHLGTYAAAPLPRVLTMVEGFWNTTQHYRRAYTDALSAEQMEVVFHDHRLMLDAIERRDAFDIEHLVRSHIRRTRVTLHGHAGMSR